MRAGCGYIIFYPFKLWPDWKPNCSRQLIYPSICLFMNLTDRAAMHERDAHHLCFRIHHHDSHNYSQSQLMDHSISPVHTLLQQGTLTWWISMWMGGTVMDYYACLKGWPPPSREHWLINCAVSGGWLWGAILSVVVINMTDCVPLMEDNIAFRVRKHNNYKNQWLFPWPVTTLVLKWTWQLYSDITL